MKNLRELRVGNLVEYNSEFYTLDTIEHVPYVTNPRTGISSIKQLYLSEFTPISLTYPILEMCGFLNNGINKKHEQLQWENEELRIIGDDGLSAWVAECKYLHQLQNLYFALSGIELDVNGII